ncbi:hypothetical protein X777_07332 [Ooceraea biroi]|uniref:Uncharacterized protein n=1 Tax=Ooceraea biroi TaxID=2015173 RepID=A0A026X1M4_OOCBI|nr:hypothetical protein X777_07332 [Ooceraea biroi]
MVSKTSRFALPSDDSRPSAPTTTAVRTRARARGGGRERKTGIQLAGTALTDRLDPPPWVRLYFKYLYALTSRQWTMPPDAEDSAESYKEEEASPSSRSTIADRSGGIVH